ncbi:hypothetical protein FACS1894187_11290 [Synergistales bacterium]|nr:hypothetical protein FACS1894187_11290 [Synergistales bacterium]
MFVANFRTAFPSVITPFLPYNLIDITADDHTQDVTLHFSAKPIYVLFININTTASEQSGFSIKDKIVGNDLELSFDYSGWGNLRGTFFVFF